MKNEPEWAENQIRHRDKLERELAEARERIARLEEYAHGLEVIGDEMKQAALTRDAVKWDAMREAQP